MVALESGQGGRGCRGWGLPCMGYNNRGGVGFLGAGHRTDWTPGKPYSQAKAGPYQREAVLTSTGLPSTVLGLYGHVAGVLGYGRRLGLNQHLSQLRSGLK